MKIRKRFERNSRWILSGFAFVFGLIMLAPLEGCQAENSTPDPHSSSADERASATASHEPDPSDSEVLAMLEPEPPTAPDEGSIDVSRRNAITRAVERCSAAIVGINVTEVRRYRVRDPWMDFFFGPRGGGRVYEEEIEGLGSGFLISSDGYILTNEHVTGGASKIIVTLTSGQQHTARLVGADAVSDVSLLKIEEGGNFDYLEMADSEDLIIGEWAIAFGNPFGLFSINAKPTVTVGVISNIGVNFMQEEKVYRGMIQTDAAISSGNSGGPLVNSMGKVIGMNAAIFSTAQTNQGAGSIGIGFAIPVNRVRSIVEHLKRDGKINREYIVGLNVKGVDARVAKALGLDRERGVYISEIYRNSPAEDAGLEPGDIILAIDNERILRPQDVQVLLSDGIAGETIEVKIRREDETYLKQLELRPAAQRRR